jgi:hypothetical protein
MRRQPDFFGYYMETPTFPRWKLIGRFHAVFRRSDLALTSKRTPTQSAHVKGKTTGSRSTRPRTQVLLMLRGW